MFIADVLVDVMPYQARIHRISAAGPDDVSGIHEAIAAGRLDLSPSSLRPRVSDPLPEGANASG